MFELKLDTINMINENKDEIVSSLRKVILDNDEKILQFQEKWNIERFMNINMNEWQEFISEYVGKKFPHPGMGKRKSHWGIYSKESEPNVFRDFKGRVFENPEIYWNEYISEVKKYIINFRKYNDFTLSQWKVEFNKLTPNVALRINSSIIRNHFVDEFTAQLTEKETKILFQKLFNGTLEEKRFWNKLTIIAKNKLLVEKLSIFNLETKEMNELLWHLYWVTK